MAPDARVFSLSSGGLAPEGHGETGTSWWKGEGVARKVLTSGHLGSKPAERDGGWWGGPREETRAKLCSSKAPHPATLALRTPCP